MKKAIEIPEERKKLLRYKLVCKKTSKEGHLIHSVEYFVFKSLYNNY